MLDEYDKKKQILNYLVKLCLDQKSFFHPNIIDIRNFHNISNEVFRDLKAVGDEATNRDQWLIYLLFQKLDSESRML